MSVTSPATIGPPHLGLITLFLKFLRFGCLAFGGPVAQIAMIRQALVEEDCWIDSARFNRLLAVLQVLPGPEAHELCVHLGIIARGRVGGLLAGLGFMLPGLLLMLIVGWLYVTWIGTNTDFSGPLLGVQIVVLAIILRAVFRIGQHIVENLLLAVVVLASLIATLAGAPFWVPLVAGGLAYAVSHRPIFATAIIVVAAAVVAAIHLTLPAVFATSYVSQTPVTLGALFLAGLKGGLLTFGGAYTAIPFVRDDTVGRGWIEDASFLDGIALSSILPAPLVIFATFVGYVAGGLAGALAITAGMFLPAFAFSLVLFERLEALIENPAFHRLLAGVAAAVVGVIAATLVDLGQGTLARVTTPWIAIALFGVALLVAWRAKGPWIAPAIIVVGGACGWLLSLG